MVFVKKTVQQPSNAPLQTAAAAASNASTDVAYYRQNKNLLNVILFGETGVGKTTLINGKLKLHGLEGSPTKQRSPWPWPCRNRSVLVP